MNNQDFEEKLSKLTFTSYLGRLFGGLFFNAFDIPGMFGMFAGAALAGKYGAPIFGLSYLAGQIYLATKGYTVSKVILGRKVLNNKTLEKAHPAIVMLRPLLAQAWMGCMMGLYFVFFLFGAAFASLFHRNERTDYDVAYNNAMTASMAAGSAGILTSVFVKYPKLVWLHDTICQTAIVSVPYSQVKSEVFDKVTVENQTSVEKMNNKIENKNRAA